jgi:plastocyanin
VAFLMEYKRFACAAGTVVFAATVLVSCGSNQPSSPAPAASAPAGKQVDPATAGSVSGVVKFDGTLPKMRVINMAAEPACAKEHAAHPAMTEDAVAGENGTLQNVVVYLKGDFSQYAFPAPTMQAEIDQKGCEYHPHVLALRTGQEFKVVNSDPVTHNIHPLPKDNREWNQSQPPGAAPIEQSFAHPEVAIPVKCNIHPWMKAYIAVFANPYYQVTGKDGSFDIKNIPPGTYTLTAWHELYGTSEQTVTIGPKESKTVTITFKAASRTS